VAVAVAGPASAATAKVKVTWNANGGKIGAAKSKSVKITKGKSVGKLPTAKRAKYKLNGWWTKKSGGKKVTKSTKVTKKVTFYAHWKKTAVSGTSPTSADDPGAPAGSTTGESTPATQTVKYATGATVPAHCTASSHFVGPKLNMTARWRPITFSGPITCTGDFKGEFSVLSAGVNGRCYYWDTGYVANCSDMFSLIIQPYNDGDSFDATFVTDRDI
jgi:hypothetical protein